jgi:hypothetical protein
MYCTAIEAAHFDNIEPDEFSKYVDENNGFEGIRVRILNKGEEKFKEWEAGLAWARGADTLQTITLKKEWEDDEPCKIFIGMQNDKKTAALKDTNMSLNNCKAILSIYNKEILARSCGKGKSRVYSANQKEALREYKLKLAEVEQNLEILEWELSDAQSRKQYHSVAKLEKTILQAELKKTGIKASIAAIRKE